MWHRHRTASVPPSTHAHAPQLSLWRRALSPPYHRSAARRARHRGGCTANLTVDLADYDSVQFPLRQHPSWGAERWGGRVDEGTGSFGAAGPSALGAASGTPGV